jgi:hypothetical protein
MVPARLFSGSRLPTEGVTMQQRERARHPHHRQKPNGKGRYDSALIKAKSDKNRVHLVLALPTPLTDEDGNVSVFVQEVDTYAIRVSKSNSGDEGGSWISKAFIVSATIQ